MTRPNWHEELERIYALFDTATDEELKTELQTFDRAALLSAAKFVNHPQLPRIKRICKELDNEYHAVLDSTKVAHRARYKPDPEE